MQMMFWHLPSVNNGAFPCVYKPHEMALEYMKLPDTESGWIGPCSSVLSALPNGSSLGEGLASLLRLSTFLKLEIDPGIPHMPNVCSASDHGPSQTSLGRFHAPSVP